MFLESKYGRHAGPANVSRLHENAQGAREGSLGHLLFHQNKETNVITNTLFDSSLITYDLSYCTTIIDHNGKHKIATLSYFDEVLNYFESPPVIVDIGCGQGEFVEILRDRGLSAFGYDPVLRTPNHFLFNSYWTETEIPGDLYVMRCVLPHIEQPWDFLGSIWSVNPDALVLVEYQSWSWVCHNSVWNQICHDHVHQFRTKDFLERNLLVDSGTFEEGEWEWVLLGKTNKNRDRDIINANVDDFLGKIDSDRENSLTKIIELSQDFKILTVWGGAAKGAMLAYSLINRLSIELRVVDEDINRQEKYLEASGVQVLSPSELTSSGVKNLVLAANPRHLDYIKSRVRGNSLVSSVTEILK